MIHQNPKLADMSTPSNLTFLTPPELPDSQELHTAYTWAPTPLAELCVQWSLFHGQDHLVLLNSIRSIKIIIDTKSTPRYLWSTEM